MTPGLYDYDLDVAEIAELWRRGSVISTWWWHGDAICDLQGQLLCFAAVP